MKSGRRILSFSGSAAGGNYVVFNNARDDVLGNTENPDDIFPYAPFFASSGIYSFVRTYVQKSRNKEYRKGLHLHNARHSSYASAACMVFRPLLPIPYTDPRISVYGYHSRFHLQLRCVFRRDIPRGDRVYAAWTI